MYRKLLKPAVVILPLLVIFVFVLIFIFDDVPDYEYYTDYTEEEYDTADYTEEEYDTIAYDTYTIDNFQAGNDFLLPNRNITIFEAPPVGWSVQQLSLQDVIDVFINIPNNGYLWVTDTYYNGRGNNRGNIAEARRYDNGRMVIEVWPVINDTGPGTLLQRSQLNELIRVMMYVLNPGDELVFHEGKYQRFLTVGPDSGNIGLNVGGTPDNPIIIRGYGNGQSRPVFHNDMHGVNMWEITMSNLVICFIDFAFSQQGSVRLQGLPKGAGPDRNGNFVSMGEHPFVLGGSHRNFPDDRPVNYLIENVVIRNSIFGNFPSQYNITVNHPGREFRNITIESNSFVGSTQAGIYIGSAVYGSPVIGINVRNNFFDHSNITSPFCYLGYTIQTKRGSVGVVFENNLVLNPWGPGIFFYGAYPHYNYPSTSHSYIRNNVILGGRPVGVGNGILIAGGPVTVENNIVIGNQRNIRMHNYAYYRYDNVWRGIYFFNNFSANGVLLNFGMPDIFYNPDWGDAVGSGHIVYNGNEIISDSQVLHDGLASLLAHRERPEGMNGLMAAINARYNSDLGAFTESEVINLLTTYFGMYA